MRVKLYACLGLLLFSYVLRAQTARISGRVTDSQSDEPLPGVNILIKNTTHGTVTDINGEFTLQASAEDILVFSFIGYVPEEVTVGNKTNITTALSPDIETLAEVVVVGYGAQKKSVVTGAISSIKAADLETLPINRVSQALQGRVSGVTIASNSGQPGSAATIRIRGITTLNNNDPLWVVDGVVVDNGGIGYLNQSDIASMEVLKDAASQAIYGARAAAGVILITTKKGQAGQLRVNYNGYYGTSAPARKLDLLNATEYATLINEASLADGGGLIYADPASFGEGTDWQEAIFNQDARRQNHELSISGGNDVSTFYLSFGHLSQEGIVATPISKYRRSNIRLNSTHKLTKWLTIGENIGYSHDKSIGLGNTNSEFGGPLSSAINLDPITPVVVTDPASAPNAGEYLNNPVMRDANNNPYGISQVVGNEMTNPLAYTQTRLGNYNWSDNVVGNVYAEAEPVKGLTLRSTFGAKLAYWGGETFTPVFYLNSSTANSITRFSRSNNRVYNWNLENTISYTKSMASHHFTVLLGQGAYQDNLGRNIDVTYANIPVDNFDDASLNFGVPADNITAGGGEPDLHTVSSLFARLNYNFGEKYLLTAIVRRDGSSNFGPNHKYGIFPSGSLGWVASEENFWPDNEIVNFLKIRGGYGVVGSDALDPFAYASTISGGRDYTVGTGDASSVGYSPDAPPNPDLKWEETTQLNVGFEATVLQDLTLTFDWYKKETSGILRRKPIPAYTGAIQDPFANIGNMENTGIEVELGYDRRVGDLHFSVTGNVSYLQNKVTNLGDVEYYGASSIQTMGTMARIEVGQPINAFYGYQRLGIFQTQEEIDNYTGEEGLIQPDAKPGDFKWADLNNNSEIDPEDRMFLGSPIPDWSYGINLAVDYKGFDFLIFGQGVAGNQIFQGLRRLELAYTNFQAAALGRWTGPGTSEDFPRLTFNDPNQNFRKASDFYIEDGDYFRIKIIQLGYSLPQSILPDIGLEKARIYLMAENLFTFTKYTGYDPEIGGSSFGIDRGIYPQARSFMLGINIGF